MRWFVSEKPGLAGSWTSAYGMNIRGWVMAKIPPENPKPAPDSSNAHFRVMSNGGREQVLALARALARQAVAEYLDEAFTDNP